MKLIKFVPSRDLGDNRPIFINPLYVESVSPYPQNSWAEIMMTSGDKIIVKDSSIDEVIKMLDIY